MLGLYLHIPFCGSICSYCNFNRGLFDAALKARYVEALAQEIAQPAPASADEAPQGEAVDTIFFGGGTPSLLAPAEVARLIDACRDAYAVSADAEVTLEANPETVNEATLAAFRAAGVNRVSFGVQSFEDDELVRLGRAHNAETARHAVRAARSAGFDNISLDLMLWLPGQSFASWLRNVDEAVALAPDHVSMYLLELYPNAPLKEAMARAAWTQSPDDEAADMYLAGLERFDAAGFEQYEISNVAQPGRTSRHNLKYWRGGRWRGLGCGAHSTMGRWRWHNVAGTTDYIDRVDAGAAFTVQLHERAASEQLAEALFMGMRLTEGVDRENIRARFGVDPWLQHEAALGPFIGEGLVWTRGARMGLSRHGMLVANGILATFV